MCESPLSIDPTQGCKEGLHCPFKSRINPHENAAEQHSLQWVLDFHLIPDTPLSLERFKAYRCSMLAARAYPDVNRTQLDIATDFVTFLFLADDIADTPETGAPKYENKLRLYEEDRFVEICFGAVPHKTDHPLVAGLADIMQRLREQTDLAWMNRFAGHIREYVLGVRWERRTRENGGIRTLATYTKMRSLCGGVLPFFDLTGMFMRSKFNCDAVECGLVKQLLLMAVNHITWTNDVFTVRREVRLGMTENLVVVLKNEKGYSWAEAIDSAVEMCNKEMEAFLLLEEQLGALKGKLPLGTAEFLEGVKHAVYGHLAWAADTSRYFP